MVDADVDVDFSRRFRALLISKGISTSARAAAALGVSRSYIGPIWNGTRTPQIKKAELLLARIGSNLRELYALELPAE